MNIKGVDQLRRHVPDLNTPFGILRLFLLPVILYLLIMAFFNVMRYSSPYWQLAAEVLLGSLGFGLLYLFFRYKQDFRARFGPLAYNHAARWLGLPGVTIIVAVIARLRSLPGQETLTFRLSIVLQILGWMLNILGVLLALRTVQVFGLDNLVMLYVYFPEDGQLVNHKIYIILRHPAYTAVLLISFGLALLNGSWISLTCALLFALSLWSWVSLVEEKELIDRFGAAYVEYRKRVPAFGPHLHNLGEFLKFLIGGR